MPQLQCSSVLQKKMFCLETVSSRDWPRYFIVDSTRCDWLSERGPSSADVSRASADIAERAVESRTNEKTRKLAQCVFDAGARSREPRTAPTLLFIVFNRINSRHVRGYLCWLSDNNNEYCCSAQSRWIHRQARQRWIGFSLFELSIECSTQRTRQHGSRLFLPWRDQLILTEWQCCLLQKLSTGTRPVYRLTTSTGAEEGDRRPRSLRAAGEWSADNSASEWSERVNYHFETWQCRGHVQNVCFLFQDDS